MFFLAVKKFQINKLRKEFFSKNKILGDSYTEREHGNTWIFLKVEVLWRETRVSVDGVTLSFYPVAGYYYI